ncbi:hypothetical protein VIGAN_05268300, partial [Vigna angularis var. angularis]
MDDSFRLYDARIGWIQVLRTLSAVRCGKEVFFGRVMREEDGSGPDDSFGHMMRERGVLWSFDTRRECRMTRTELVMVIRWYSSVQEIDYEFVM